MQKQATNRKWMWLAIIILMLYPLRHIPFGVEWWDTGYNYANYKFMNGMDPMWISGTFLGTMLGHLMTLLPFGKYMMAMNFYTGLTVSFLGPVFFLFFVKKVKLPMGIAFLGEFLAESLCWCPTALLYNYLTYCLMGLGVIFLYYALTERTKRENVYFILAGICLGLNVLTRLPNLAQMALIVAVWAMGILEKKGFGKVFKDTMFCLLGYVIGLGIGLLFATLTLGFSTYVSGIQRLLSMPGEASDYSLYSMVYSQIMGYRLTLYWLKYPLGIAVIIGVLFYFLGKKSKVMDTAGKILAILGILGATWYFYLQEMPVFDYHKTGSFFQFACFFVVFYIIAGVIIIFGKAFEMKDKLLAGMGMIIAFITPLGSNNQLYSTVNNLFLALPFGIYMLFRIWKKLGEKAGTGAIRYSLATYFVVFALQVTLFGCTYVFHEADGGKNLHTKIVNNDILKGMRTSPDHASVLQEINDYVSENHLSGREVLLYGRIPSLSYYLDMPFLFTPWPDLASYNSTVMREDLQGLEQEMQAGGRDYPILLLDNICGQYILDALEAGTGLEDPKLQMILDFASSYNYEVVFQNDKFVMLTGKP